MQKRKTLSDLKPRDKFFIVSSNGLIETKIIESVGMNLIVTENNQYVIQYYKDDLTCWNIKCKPKYGPETTAYFNLVDALKERRKILEERLVSVFKQQQDFLSKVKDLNDLIYRCNIDIVDEIKKSV